jgi:hypothetical protein
MTCMYSLRQRFGCWSHLLFSCGLRGLVSTILEHRAVQFTLYTCTKRLHRTRLQSWIPRLPPVGCRCEQSKQRKCWPRVPPPCSCCLVSPLRRTTEVWMRAPDNTIPTRVASEAFVSFWMFLDFVRSCSCLPPAGRGDIPLLEHVFGCDLPRFDERQLMV